MIRVFRAMSTDVAVTAERDEAAIAAQVADRFAAAEHRFSRFRPDSELSALNRARGPMRVSAPPFDALARARLHVVRTGGVFDPGVSAALIAAGYQRSFAPGALDRPAAAPPPARRGHLHEVLLDPASRTVLRPRHVQLDLGGMIKGATVDEAATLLPGAGAIDAGGDAVVRGPAPGGGDWLIEIEDPLDPARTLATIGLRDAAVATSAANRRCWRLGAVDAHHLIDPRTQRPATTDLLQVTVVAATAELAEVLAKAAFVLGTRAGRALLAGQPGVGAVLVGRDRGTTMVGALGVREGTA